MVSKMVEKNQGDGAANPLVMRKRMSAAQTAEFLGFKSLTTLRSRMKTGDRGFDQDFPHPRYVENGRKFWEFGDLIGFLEKKEKAPSELRRVPVNRNKANTEAAEQN
jgi:hypothetical protein